MNTDMLSLEKEYTHKDYILNSDSMKRFLEWFYKQESTELVERINEYAEKNNLQIISVSADKDLHGAIVLFEGNKPRYRW